MDQITDPANLERAKRERQDEPAAQPRRWRWKATALGVAVAAGLFLAWLGLAPHRGNQAAAAVPPTPVVTVSQPLQREVDVRAGFLGQFSAIDRVELRAQVGGTLTEIHFKDGQIVHKGDLLFVIDPRPYEIKLAQAKAALQTATARVALANNQLSRATSLKRSDFATQETVDQRTNDQDASQAAVEDAKARVRDAELDLEYCHVLAPFTGRIGARQVSIGSLVAGSRAATSPTTLLATLVSLDPLYLDFDMSESDFLTFSRERARLTGPLANKVLIGLSDENSLCARRHARLHRQCARSLQRHHSRARHGAEPRPVSGAGPVRAAARRDRTAGAGLSAAGRRRRARPVAAAGDDRRPGRHREAEDRRPPAICAAACG